MSLDPSKTSPEQLQSIEQSLKHLQSIEQSLDKFREKLRSPEQLQSIEQSLDKFREKLRSPEQLQSIEQSLEHLQSIEQSLDKFREELRSPEQLLERQWQDSLLKQLLEHRWQDSLLEQSPEQIEISIEIPENTPPEKVRDLVRQAALQADSVHRANGGHGLKIDTVNVLSDSRVPEGANK